MTFYETLGVPAGASTDDIKKAFRETAKTKHPDKGGDASAFAAASEAYETLSDPLRRKAYDKELADAPPPPYDGPDVVADLLTDVEDFLTALRKR